MSTAPPPPSAPTPPPPAGGPGAGGRPLASWGSRAGAWLVDVLIAAVPAIVAVIGVGGVFSGADTLSSGAATIALLGYLASILVAAWNLGYRQGTTGQSIGKGLLDIEVVDADDGRHIGAGLGFARWLVAGFLGSLCILDYLWPLWDDRNRAWHDMVLGTSVVQTR